MKKALIIGISGQDGSLLTRFLLEKGYEVHGTSRDAQGTKFDNLSRMKLQDKVKLHSLSTSDFRSTLSTIQKVMPDEIYHLAGQSSVGLSFDQPVETFESIALSTLNLLESVRFLNFPCKIYSAGSSECFGDTPPEGANELTPFAPKSPYGIAKASSYWLIANYRNAYNLFACTGILFNHESPLRPSRFVTKKIIKAARDISQGKQDHFTMGNLSIMRDWGWAEDYVKAMWLMLQQDKPQDFVISSGVSTSLEDFVNKSFAYFGLDWKKYVKIDATLMRPSDIGFSKGDSSLARKTLNWAPTKSLDQIIEELAKWESAHE